MKKISAALVALGVLLGIAFVVSSHRKAPLQKIHLSDGSDLIYLGVTYGTNHQFCMEDSAFQRLLRKLPSTWFSRFRSQVFTSSSSQKEPFLMLWCLRENCSSDPQSVHYSIADTQQESELEYLSNMSVHLATNRQVIGSDIRVFPRRASQIFFHVHQYDSNYVPHLIGQFTAANPVPQNFSEWNADPLPCAKNDGNFSATLQRVVANAGDDSPVRRYTNQNDLRVFLSFKTTESGKPVNHWRVEDLNRTDATGNVSAGTSWRSYDTADGRDITVMPSLWPDEPVWKMRVEFSKESNFANDELVSFPPIPIPEKGKYTETKFEKTVQGRQVRLLGITAPGVSLPGSGSSNQSEYSIHVQVFGASEGYRLSGAKIVNEEGKKLFHFGRSSNGKGHYTFPLGRAPQAQSLEITLALHKSHFLEFLAKPEILSATNTSLARQ